MGRARKMNPPNLHPNRNARWGYLERSIPDGDRSLEIRCFKKLYQF